LRRVVGLVLLIAGALVGCETSTPVLPPTATPEPPSTVALGTFDCPRPPTPTDPQLQSCWRGKLNGAYVTVGAGLAGSSPTGGTPTSNQGVIVVTDGTEVYAPLPGSTVYTTPQAMGAVRIRSAEGPRLTLATSDPAVTFVFDLQTRQWVNP
jgi:ABC-type transport system substrate-binding protein